LLRTRIREENDWTFRHRTTKKLVTVSQIRNFQTCGETSREVAKRPGIETPEGAERGGGELAK